MSDSGSHSEKRPEMSMSEIVGANAKHVCGLLGWDGLEFGAKLVDLGLDRDAQVGRRIWKAQRRILIDDLMLIAVALDVSPFSLMCPPAGVRIRHPRGRGADGRPILEEGDEVLGARFLHFPGDPKYLDAADRSGGVRTTASGEGGSPSDEMTRRREAVGAWESDVWARARDIPAQVAAIVTPEVVERGDLIAQLASPETIARLDEVDWDWDASGLPEVKRLDRLSTDELRERLENRKRSTGFKPRGDVVVANDQTKPGQSRSGADT